ncbi:MAG: DUF4450 domain-containing protein [Bacteroidota bacterium]|nr:DUF4450 domain-containing protein [Bacteroidota bacterium]
MKVLITNILLRFGVFFYCISLFGMQNGKAQSLERTFHYKPAGNDFVLVKGTRKFNRALYGGNSAFRVEAGDLPEFAMYMPGMGGNCKIGFVVQGHSKWITEADSVTTIYRPGSMLYEIRDQLLGKALLQLTVIGMYNRDGMIVKLDAKDLLQPIEIIIAYGGTSGKKFSRDGDMGADPESSFYLKPENCKENIYHIQRNSFHLTYGFTKPSSQEERYEIQYKPLVSAIQKDKPKEMYGVFPLTAQLRITDALRQQSPLELQNSLSHNDQPLIAASFEFKNNDSAYFLIQKDSSVRPVYDSIYSLFTSTEKTRVALANRIVIETPDSFINPIGGALSVAADAIWEQPSYMHGAVAWRMRLPAWRGPYCADVLGWHDRAAMHYDSYALSQVKNISEGEVTPDTASHWVRQLEKMGTAMFSNGYICRNPGGDIRPNHYDMNLVFVDGLLNHFNYTGDTGYVRTMWPLIKLHLEWEKRNFDADGDGLYDAYCCIWASDALEYSGGGVTHSSAYNYRANLVAAQLAKIIGEDATPYAKEAKHILQAMNQNLWLKGKGWFAEYKDILGERLVHPSAGLWTIYHSVDENVSDAFQNYQMMRYVDHNIPHIPFTIKELPSQKFSVLSTTNWQPYTWSVNNVVLAENLHTALAYWQSNENNKAFNLWESSLVEAMYLGGSPANFPNISYYDFVRGELYRDFADPIGMAARTLTEGLFGITPFALQDSLLIKPGLPDNWTFANIQTPDITFKYQAKQNIATYLIEPHYSRLMNLYLQIKAPTDKIKAVMVNGKSVKWRWIENTVANPMIEVEAGKEILYNIAIEWSGNKWSSYADTSFVVNEQQTIHLKNATFLAMFDPQGVVAHYEVHDGKVMFELNNKSGYHTFFLKLKQEDCIWYAPVSFQMKELFELSCNNEESSGNIKVGLRNNTHQQQMVTLVVNVNSSREVKKSVQIAANDSLSFTVKATQLFFGSNKVRCYINDELMVGKTFYLWNNSNTSGVYTTIDLSSAFNDKVTRIFKNKYLSPRSNTTTLQLPWQGLGNWCVPLAETTIDDSGVRAKAGYNNTVYLKNIPFKTPGNISDNNIVFTSQWDNYPRSVSVKVAAKASHAYFLMAGSTNHMQSRFVNAQIVVAYTDNTCDTLMLENPSNWYPIEQDYMINGLAYTTGAPRSYRLLLKSGEFTRDVKSSIVIKGVTAKAIDGGAATVLDMPLNNKKEIKEIKLRTVANEVVVGLMSITLVK